MSRNNLWEKIVDMSVSLSVYKEHLWVPEMWENQLFGKDQVSNASKYFEDVSKWDFLAISMYPIREKVNIQAWLMGSVFIP